MTLNDVKDGFSSPEREKQERFSDRLFDLSYTELDALNCTAYISSEPLSFENRFEGDKKELKIGAKWARNVFDCAWFHITGRKDKNADTVLVNCGGEGLVYDKNGNELQGITCFAASYGGDLGPFTKRVVPIREEMLEGDNFDFWIDCGANDLFGEMRNESRMSELASAKLNAEMRALAFDVQILLTVLDYGEDEEFKSRISSAVNGIMKENITPENASLYRERLRPLLSEKSEECFTYYAIGHAHLDLAWLWPIRESFRKGGRTFSTQIMNIERYPEYIFGASQAQLYAWVKDKYPSLYSKVKELVKKGRWDVQGATWVEPDSNLICGESLIRQFFYGKKFFKEEFGLDMKIFWVPDSFGYSACVPQVMKLADVPYFLTQKMSWNTFNKFPYHSFYWKGLDGSTVLAHMLPEDTYNSPMRGDYLKAGEKRYAERKISDKAALLFGIGDGGAGPGFEHIERALRYKDLKSMPKVRMCRSMDFFADFDDGKTPYPTHSGELYLEKHQGTYTTRSANKKYNRKCEFALRNYEMTAAEAEKRGITPPISKDELDKIWKEILLYQFHDILPGSSINRVYEESVPRYKAIYNKLTNSTSDMLCGMSEGVTAVNLNPFDYDTKIKYGGKWYSVKLPALGKAILNGENVLNEFHAKATYDTIENDKIRVKFNSGVIVSLFDKELGSEFIPENGKAGAISIYDDFGDCWDMTGSRAEYIQTKKDAVCTCFRARTDGAKAWAECRFKAGNSEISQYYYILDGDNTLYCDLDIDMRDNKSMLRLAVPVNIDADEAAFNIQFGHIKRKTTENTPRELAQFEVSGQKFVDMSEDGRGISFINDCKYGYRCKNGVIDLNLVRSPEYPGENVDLGRHTVKWALMPHSGSLGKETYKKAYFVNNPIIIVNGTAKTGTDCSAYKTTNENIILETVKLPEDKNGIIARFYNCSEREQSAKITLEGYKMSETVNISEEKIAEKTDSVLTLHGFELINIRFTDCGSRQ